MAPDHMDAIVRQWAKERPELDASDMEVIGRILRVARLLDLREEQLFRRHGLNRGEFDLLLSLVRAGPPHALSPTALATTLLLSTSAMTNRIDRLESAGLVERRFGASDRRRVLVRLTDQGSERIEEALAAHVVHQRTLLRTLDDQTRADLSDALRLVATDLERPQTSQAGDDDLPVAAAPAGGAP